MAHVMVGHISTFDKSIRVWIGLAMIVGSIQDAQLLPWTVVGAFLISTAWLGFCPMYAISGCRPSRFPQSDQTELKVG